MRQGDLVPESGNPKGASAERGGRDRAPSLPKGGNSIRVRNGHDSRNSGSPIKGDRDQGFQAGGVKHRIGGPYLGGNMLVRPHLWLGFALAVVIVCPRAASPQTHHPMHMPSPPDSTRHEPEPKPHAKRHAPTRHAAPPMADMP